MNGHPPARPLVEAALGYAARGWPVLPCKPRGKKPLTPHGFKDATTDREVIQSWWKRWPNANIGLVTGAESGLFVLDVDGPAGAESLANLQDVFETLPETATQRTGGGGRHILFKHHGYPIGNTAGKLGPGLDTRGDGGYIVVTPSMHASGNAYAWEECYAPDEIDLAPVPPFLVKLLQTKASRSDRQLQDGEWERFRLPERIPSGQRNDVLFRHACSSWQRGKSREDVVAEVFAADKALCSPPLQTSQAGYTELLKLVASATSYDREKARKQNTALKEGVAPYFDHTEVDVAEGVAAVKRIVGHWFEYEPEQQTFLLKSTAGIGKTAVALEMIAGIHENNPDARIWFLTLTNELLLEIKDRLRTEHGIRARTVFGRTYKPKGEELCTAG